MHATGRVIAAQELLAAMPAQGLSCPPGHRLLRIAVEQVYANCGARVVRLQARGAGRD